MPLILGTNSIKDTGYDVANSLRFDDGSSDNLTKTPSSDGNKRTWTWSGWVKKSKVPQWGGLFQAGNSTNITDIYFYSDGTLTVRDWNGSSLAMYLITNRLFRDPTAWYHIVVAVDTTQSTASNRVKIYVNGTQETSFSTETYPSQNLDTNFNDTNHQNILGAVYQIGGSLQYYDGYMAEIVFIDGSQLTPTSFGEFDEDSPTIWKPIDVSGLTFGTNGFYLDFENASSLGADVSGNGNNFTVNNLTSIDQSTDTCTNNFSTFNSLIPNTNITYSQGNLDIARDSGGDNRIALSTIAVSSGKWYVEMKCVQNQDHTHYGIVASDSVYSTSNSLAQMVNAFAYKMDGTVQEYNQSNLDTGEATFTTGDIIVIALYMDNNKIYFHKNGTYINSGNPAGNSNGYSITADKEYVFASAQNYATGKTSANFGSPSFSISSGNADGNGFGNFEYAVPSGFLAVCTKNLAENG